MTRLHEPGGTGPGRQGRVLYVGQCYYNTWYLSRALRERGWKADVLQIDAAPENQMFYHGYDRSFRYRGIRDLLPQLLTYLRSVPQYDIFHYSGAHHLSFGPYLHRLFGKLGGPYADTRLLRLLGKKIVYSNNGCLDGVTQSSFRQWGPEPVCDSCVLRDVPSMCSDERNATWGRVRNEIADYQILLGGNRADFNIDPRIHEVPEFYCLDENLWHPDLLIPGNYRLPFASETVKIYHSIGNMESRTAAVTQKNIKSTHVYLPLIDRLKAEGHDVELIFFHDVPNRKLRYYQAQADVVVDMLTFGFFGANVREAMMLGKPVVCFIRPEWREQMRAEIPEYADELPIVSATPATVYDVLKDLVTNPEKRRAIGQRSREFAVKWHSAGAGAERLERIYLSLLGRARNEGAHSS